MASSLSRWLALTRHEKLLFIGAWAVLLSTRPIWKGVPFRWVWKVAGGAAGRVPDASAIREIERIGQAIDRAARVPRSTCLTRSLAAAVLLRFAGLPQRLVTGVQKGSGGAFSAHAWMISGNRDGQSA